jgi:hypothetical protein
MRVDNLLQFIVPLTFLAIWALTSLFNREAPPLPQRMGRPQPPGGPGGPGAGGATFRTEALAREASLRWATPGSVDRAVVRRPPGRPDEEILIIEETRRPAGAPVARSAAGAGPRRSGRSRPAAQPPKRPPEPPAARPLGGALSTSAPLTAPINRPLELNPLALPASPLHAAPHDLARSVSEPTRQAGRTTVAGEDYRVLLSDPSKLREAIVLNEILQPPLALRPRRPGPVQG